MIEPDSYSLHRSMVETMDIELPQGSDPPCARQSFIDSHVDRMLEPSNDPVEVRHHTFVTAMVMTLAQVAHSCRSMLPTVMRTMMSKSVLADSSFFYSCQAASR